MIRGHRIINHAQPKPDARAGEVNFTGLVPGEAAAADIPERDAKQQLSL